MPALVLRHPRVRLVVKRDHAHPSRPEVATDVVHRRRVAIGVATRRVLKRLHRVIERVVPGWYTHGVESAMWRLAKKKILSTDSAT